MLQSIFECSREERLERALMAIQTFGLISDDSLLAFTKIYCIAHAALGSCTNPHFDWLSIIEECEKHGKENNLYDAEKILNKCHDKFSIASQEVHTEHHVVDVNTSSTI